MERLLLGLYLLFFCACQAEHHPNRRVNPAPPTAPAPLPVAEIPPPPAPAPAPEPKSPAPPPPQLSKAELEREHLAVQVWQSTLGKLYRDFLFNSRNRASLPQKAQVIVDRILADSDQTPARIAAMHVMNEDLYIGQLMNPDLASRISLLESEMIQRRHKEKSNAIKMIFGQIPFVFLATLPMGSPLIRAEYRKQVRQFFRGMSARIKRAEVPIREKVPWDRVMSTQALVDYETGRALSSFSKTFAPMSMIEWLIVQQKEEMDGSEIPRHELENFDDL